MTSNNPNVDLVEVNANAKSDQISSICSQDIEGKHNFDNSKDHNSLENLQKLTCNNPNLDLVMVNAYAKFDQIPSILSEDIERKRNFDNNQGPLLCCKFVNTLDRPGFLHAIYQYSAAKLSWFWIFLGVYHIQA